MGWLGVSRKGPGHRPRAIEGCGQEHSVEPVNSSTADDVCVVSFWPSPSQGLAALILFGGGGRFAKLLDSVVTAQNKLPGAQPKDRSASGGVCIIMSSLVLTEDPFSFASAMQIGEGGGVVVDD